MHAIVYTASTGAVVGVVRDAAIDGQRLKGSNCEMVTTAPYLLVENDPGEIGNINELSGAAILAGAKAAKKQEIAAARWNEMSAPTVVDGYSATWYADKESQNDMLRSCIDMQTAISLGHLPPDTTTQWKTATGDFVVVGVNDLVTVRLLLSQRQQTTYTKEATLKAQIDAATTVAEVEAVEW